MNNSQLHIFFKERLVELLHHKTLDSYRVRYNNAHTALKELLAILNGWRNRKVKNAKTVQLCIREVLTILKNDEILIYPHVSKNSVSEIISQFEKELNSDKHTDKIDLACSHLEYLISSILLANREKFLKNLMASIENILSNENEIEEPSFVSTLQNLDNLTSSFIRELLDSGYSKRGLFNIVRSYAKERHSIDTYRKFISNLEQNINRPHTVILSLFLHNSPNDLTISNFLSEINISEIPEKYRTEENIQKFMTPQKRRRFYVVKCKASDGDSAIKIAKTQLSEEMDTLHFHLSLLNLKLDPNAIVIRDRGESKDLIFLPVKFYLDGDFSQGLSSANTFRKRLSDIIKNTNVSEDVKERLKSSLRHLRIGNLDEEIEQRFINYWIALEYIFSSPKIEENTYNRLTTNLTTVLSINYVKRNLRYLEFKLREKNLLSSEERITSNNIDSLYSNTSDVLLKYRLKKFKARLFNHKENRKNYVKLHTTNLTQHLSRIYHLRNELIHEAAINQNIEDLTSNLRYYLMFIIDKIVSFMFIYMKKTTTSISIEDFFYEMEMRNKMIEEDWSFDSLMRDFPDDL